MQSPMFKRKKRKGIRRPFSGDKGHGGAPLSTFSLPILSGFQTLVKPVKRVFLKTVSIINNPQTAMRGFSEYHIFPPPALLFPANAI
ncbi:MAG: hypothetical protein E7424_01785 [Ruminococcaceae bacterium]|nr:hypothetical protein [Oscillospiraceae bacterium]